MLQVLDTGIASAEENMACDEHLLDALDPKGNPILHLYRWSGPSATFGYFVSPDRYINLVEADRYRLSLARRPTGGGIVFHIWDLAFSFLMPSAHPSFFLNPLDNYRFVNQVVCDVMGVFFSLRGSAELIEQPVASLGSDCQHFCMAKPTQYDVVYQGRKIAGAAQRKRKQGYLHQGTISLCLPHIGLLNDVLLSKKEVVQAMLQTTFAPLGCSWETKALNESRSQIEHLLAEKFMAKL